ncbi:Cytochrome P450 704C1 [Nymphaea thermarum]|nr:Cytochrome P450 704C1 [Nymphaea thermarum]
MEINYCVGYAVASLLLVSVSLCLENLHREISRQQRVPTCEGNYVPCFDRLYDYQAEVAAHNKTVRYLAFSQSEVYTADPQNIEYILKTNFANYDKGAHHQEIAKDLLGDGIFAVDGQKWRHQRKVASYEFSTKVLRDFSSVVFRSNAAVLARKISDKAEANMPMDIHELFTKYSMDCIFEVGFGLKLNILDGSNEEAIRFAKAFDESNALTYHRYCNLFWKVKRFFNVGTEATLRKNIAVIDEFVRKIISSRRKQYSHLQSPHVKEDILSRFLLESEKNPETMNDSYLKDIILNFMIAGKDTTGGTLSWFIYMLCKHPLVQEKIAQEVKDMVGSCDKGQFTQFVEKITEGSLEKLHYLHAALSETLRLYPAVPLDRQSACKDDILPDGFKVKKGDGVNYLTYAMGRMKYIWGDDAEDFRPERWLHDGVFRPESPFKFPAFHAGPRTCLGKDFAYRQMKIVAALLTAFFKFKLKDSSKAVTYKTMLTLHIDQGLHVRAFHRLL